MGKDKKKKRKAKAAPRKHQWIVISGFTPAHHKKYRKAAEKAGHKSLSSWVREVLDEASAKH